MTWVRKQAAQQEHTCQPPMRRPPGLDGWATLRGVPVGDVSDLWRCDTCRKLWRITKLSGGANVPLNRRWRPATWWQRLTHPDRGTRPSRDGHLLAGDVNCERLTGGSRLAPGASPRPPRPVPPPPFEPVVPGKRGQRLSPAGAAAIPPPAKSIAPPPTCGAGKQPPPPQPGTRQPGITPVRVPPPPPPPPPQQRQSGGS